ncbi:MAG: isoleucine--tRNA ligase [Eubacteriales bacterium]|nr:isoleucine--tRNA ligase [Eubacteriales bacterium]
MYKPVKTDLDFIEREQEIRAFWKENDIFGASVRKNEGHEEFTFYDGPPTANGMPHIGHVLTRTIKDIIPRYKTMKGYHVLRKAGWDTHGLPVELEVEKQLGINGKPQIEKYGIEPFIAKCKESVWKYKGEWEIMSDKIGYWADMKNPYITYDNKYIESVWWSIKQIADKGLLYKGHKIVPYCPRCGTALSSHEVAQGYKDVKETSVFVRFKVKGQENLYLAAWTTTPWTLPSNVALCVNADEEYAYSVAGDGDTYITAAALARTVLGDEITTVKTVRGAELVGMEYEPLFDFAAGAKNAFRVVEDGYVTLTDGSGIVHIAPAFGEDDARVGRRFGLPFVQFVNEQGRLTEETGRYAGMFVKDADKPIIADLKASGKLMKAIPFEHSYPFCWRCDTPLIYYARSTWFIKVTAVKDKLIANNNQINWYPDTIKQGRMGNFLENVIDWGLSRERYWGTPLPVWECECGHHHVIGSIAELKELGDNVPENIELHKPFIDAVTLRCPKCGGTMHRVKEVIDCWYDSGSMPFAQLHYPFENKEQFEKNFPADFISEAIDQTRGWFYTLLTISTLLFDRPPFRNCIVLGHVCDKDGVKMSKHKGNVIKPDTVLDKQGADAVRWYFYTASAPWLPSRFYPEAVSESQRKFMGTLWNTYAFFVLYANIDKFDPTAYKLSDCKLSVMDRWILSGLNSLIRKVDEGLAAYSLTDSARAIQDFTDELSNWYVRRGRERYWGPEMTEDKISAYMTLYTVLVTVAKLSAPFVPYVSEMIYRNLVCSVDKDAPISVHLCSFPVCDESRIDAELEENMEFVLRVVALGRAARSGANVKNRQPLAKMYVCTDRALPERYTALIADELNVREVVFTTASDDFTSYNLKPQMRTLGPKYGKLLGSIGRYLASCDGNAVMAAFARGEEWSFELDGRTVVLGADDVLATQVDRPGFAAETDEELTVVLDTTITEELLDEGLIREIVSKVQNMRKKVGLEVTDHIVLGFAGSGRTMTVAERYAERIGSASLADEVKCGESFADSEEWDVNGEKLTISIRKV